MKRDVYTNLDVKLMIEPDVYDGAKTSEVIDTQGYGGMGLALIVGAVTVDGSTVTIQHSDTTTSGDFEDVEDNEIVGLEPENTLTDELDDSVIEGQYVGYKRYIRAVVASPETASASFSMVALGGLKDVTERK